MTRLDKSDLRKALADLPFTAADRAVARHLQNHRNESNTWILFAAALAHAAAREGHAYLDLADPQNYARCSLRSSHFWPELEYWKRWRKGSSSLGNADDIAPLVLENENALYLRKYFNHECALAKLLTGKMNEIEKRAPLVSSGEAVIDQALATSFFVITGGPGTGKTTLALRYLDAFLDQWTQVLPPRIAAVAPTGKAAARLEETIRNGIERLDSSEERKALLAATPCLTIHRLLGVLPHRASFRKDERRKVDYDLLVIDESSMIDLPLMRRLFEATPENCSLMLMGDKDQLASVDVGTVLHDLLKAGEIESSLLSKRIHKLTKTYRFSENSTIYRCCEAARNGDLAGLQKLLAETCDDFSFFPVKEGERKLSNRLIEKAITRRKSLLECGSAQDALQAITASTILAPTRVGPFGTYAINAESMRRIQENEHLDPDQPVHGCPIIVLENNYELELFNGDLGILWADEEKRIHAWFNSSDGGCKKVRLSELPRHETAFALTIHKSQGSEFDETIVVLSPNDSGNLTRELIYTAFSRAKTKLELHAYPKVLETAIQRQVKRATLLEERILANKRT